MKILKKTTVFLLCAHVLLAQDKKSDFVYLDLKPEIKIQQVELQKAIENKGYADKEIDTLHKQIQGMLSGLEDVTKNGTNGEKVIELTIDSGETMLWNGDMYTYLGKAYIFVSPDKKLQKIYITIDRFKNGGATFFIERRELRNPTPGVPEEGIDPNNDMVVVYFEKDYRAKDFSEMGRYTMTEIDRYKNRVGLIKIYKQYMRKTVRSLNLKFVRDKASKRAKMLHMVDFE